MFDTGLNNALKAGSCKACRADDCAHCYYPQDMEELNGGAGDAQDFIYLKPHCACFVQREAYHWDLFETRRGRVIVNTEPTKQREGDQTLPDGGGDCVQDEALAALGAAMHQMQESKRVGQERYGSVLRTFNGRRGIRDVLEEARDLFVYLTQVEMEVRADESELRQVIVEVLKTVNDNFTTVYFGDEEIMDTVSGMILDRILTGVALRRREGEQ